MRIPQPALGGGDAHFLHRRRRLRSGAGDETVYVASLRSSGDYTLLRACERDGTPYFIDASHPWTAALKGNWELGSTVRLVDLNRDHLPDLVRVDQGLVRILPNESTAGAKQASSFAFGAARTFTITPAFVPDTAWVIDFNGDAIPDLAEALGRSGLGVLARSGPVGSGVSGSATREGCPLLGDGSGDV